MKKVKIIELRECTSYGSNVKIKKPVDYVLVEDKEGFPIEVDKNMVFKSKEKAEYFKNLINSLIDDCDELRLQNSHCAELLKKKNMNNLCKFGDMIYCGDIK